MSTNFRLFQEECFGGTLFTECTFCYKHGTISGLLTFTSSPANIIVSLPTFNYLRQSN